MIDLHSHSTASDGSLSPAEVAASAAARGVRVLALTDHDTVAGNAALRRAATTLGVEAIEGVEISTTVGDGRSVHVLGYLFRPDDDGLARFLERVRGGRGARNRAIADRLAQLGMPVSLERVEALADGTVGRPHFARALVIEGYVRSVEDAFDRWLGDGRPACVESTAVSPRAAVDAIHAAGGVAILAHPLTHGRSPDQARAALAAAATDGFDGVEVYYRNHTPGEITMLRSFAAQHGLLATGGSDMHELPWPAAPQVPTDSLDRLRVRAERWAAA